MVEYRKSVTVLGIDPGTTRVGYGIISGTRIAPVFVASGVIGNAALGAPGRLLEIHKELKRLIASARPDIVAVEKLFFSKNVKTALSVAEARGIILLTAALADRRVYEYTPQEIKIALTGNGGAAKIQVAAMAKSLLKITKLPRWDDETDAIAISLTGLVSARNAYH